MQAAYRDLASPELWEDSLDRSRRRRALAAQGRKEMARRKQASAAVSAAMVVTQTAPAIALAGGGGASGPKVAQSSPANRAIDAAPGWNGQLLRLGSSGAEVARVQTAVGVQPDGVFGRQTDAAVRGYQQRNGLAVDGIVGPITWRSLFGGTTGASYGGEAPRYGFTIQRASTEEAAHVRPAIGHKGAVAKIVVRTIPNQAKPHTKPAVLRTPKRPSGGLVKAPESSGRSHRGS